MLGVIEEIVDKLEGQLRRYKTKLQKRYVNENQFHFDALEDEDDDEETPKVVRTKKFAIKPMSVEEATMQMELLGHDFFVFLNAETDDVNVVYMRKDGNFGLIEPVF